MELVDEEWMVAFGTVYASRSALSTKITRRRVRQPIEDTVHTHADAPQARARCTTTT
jgi:hypothetical protein